MRKVVNALRGQVRLEAAGPFPERFLNICAANGVSFWGLEWLDEHTLRLTVTRRDSRRAMELGERALCSVEVYGRKGLPYFLGRFQRRYALLVGMACSLAAVCLCSQFVLVIDVTGNERVTDEQVRTVLRANGFGVGTYGPSVNAQELSHGVLEDLEDLAFFTVNLYGIRAEVVVRERVEAPEVVDETVVADVVADQGGIITQVLDFAGTPLVEKGDTVAPGDLLLSGTVEYPSGTDPETILRTDYVRARGEVWARTWRTLSAAVPDTYAGKVYTGREKVRWALLLGEKRVNFYHRAGISFPDYDKITKVTYVTLPNGLELPLGWVKETYVEYTCEERETDLEEAEAALKEALEARLAEETDGGEIVTMNWSSVRENGLLTVTLQAECLEEIGVTVERE